MASGGLTKNSKDKNAVHQLDLRNTRLRDGMIKFFKENPGLAFSENEIKQILNSQHDRTSIYRTIKTLLKKVFIHKIVCENGVLKYALSESKNNLHSHVHFQCTRCEKVFCLKDCTIHKPALPEAFEPESYYFLVKGNCRNCIDC
jgi:Fur family transcriptional regulator, ferric uptake regulator